MYRPKLICVSGLPATGKSTLTAYLSKELGMLAFSKDDFKVALADSMGFTDHESTQPFGKSEFCIAIPSCETLP